MTPVASPSVASAAPPLVLPRRRKATEPTDRLITIDTVIAAGFAFAMAGLHFFGFQDYRKSTLLVMGLMFLVAAACCVRRPLITVLILAVYLPFQLKYPMAIVSGMNFSNAVIGLMTISVFASARERRRHGDRTHVVDVLLGMFLVILLISHIVTGFTRLPIGTFIDYYKVTVLPPILYLYGRALLKSDYARRQLLIAVSCGAVFNAVTSIREGRETRGGSIESSRILGFMNQSNSMGAYHAYYSVPLAAILACGLLRRHRLAAALGLVIVVRGTMFTFSRGAYLAMGAGVGSAVFVGNPVMAVAGGATYVCTAAVFPQLIPEAVIARFGHTFGKDVSAEPEAEELDLSAQQRLVVWESAYYMIKDNPVFGVGLYNFTVALLPYMVDEIGLAKTGRGTKDAHNGYILLGSEAGMPALLTQVATFIALALTGFVTAIRAGPGWSRMTGLTIMGTTGAVLLSNMFGSRTHDLALIGVYWLIAGAAVNAAIEVERRRRANRPSIAIMGAGRAPSAL